MAFIPLSQGFSNLQEVTNVLDEALREQIYRYIITIKSHDIFKANVSCKGNS